MIDRRHLGEFAREYLSGSGRRSQDRFLWTRSEATRLERFGFRAVGNATARRPRWPSTWHTDTQCDPRYSMVRGAALLTVPVNMNVNSLQVIIKPTLRGEKTWRGN
jgi:hypothetical protein